MKIKNKMGYINMESLPNEDSDCIICFDPVMEDKSFVKCHKCFKLYHWSCFNTWICRYKKERKVICPHCQQAEIMFYKVVQPCCFPFFKKKKKETIVYALTINKHKAKSQTTMVPNN
tara:strand:- start:194 stop:544 length:351 start_codon:yes stop_codon:yes gene_type:complete